MKRALNSYIIEATGFSGADKLRASYKKKEFVPFVDERDHLGNLINQNNVRSYQRNYRTRHGTRNYKNFKLSKSNKIDVPRPIIENPD